MTTNLDKAILARPVTFATQYQVELFWIGLAFNLAGIVYISSKVIQATKEHAKCVGAV